MRDKKGGGRAGCNSRPKIFRNEKEGSRIIWRLMRINELYKYFFSTMNEQKERARELLLGKLLEVLNRGKEKREKKSIIGNKTITKYN